MSGNTTSRLALVTASARRRSGSTPITRLPSKNRGIVYVYKADYDRAIADFDQAIRIDPNNAGALYWRGKAEQRKGDVAGGNADVGAAEKIDPKVFAQR